MDHEMTAVELIKAMGLSKAEMILALEIADKVAQLARFYMDPLPAGIDARAISVGVAGALQLINSSIERYRTPSDPAPECFFRRPL